MARHGRGTYVVAATLAALLVHTRAHAEPSDPEALFRAGRALLQEGKFAEACLRFAESQRLEPRLGTLLNLAGCHELQGRTATALAEYEQAAAEATRAGRDDQVEFARKQATALGRRLSQVTVVASGWKAPADAEVLVDGRPFGALGRRFAVDPGEHVVTVRHPSIADVTMPLNVEMGPWTTTLDVPAPPPARSATRPAPAKQDAPAAPAAPTGSPSGPSAAAPAPAAPDSRLPTAGLVVATAGVLAVGVASYFGVRTFSLKSAADAECDARGCSARGVDLDREAGSTATASTVLFLAGGAALAGGIALYVVSSKSPSQVTRAPLLLRF